MDRFGGIELTIIKMMSVYFNFTIKLVDCHGEYGAKLSNGTWTGLLRKLIDNVNLFTRKKIVILLIIKLINHNHRKLISASVV